MGVTEWWRRITGKEGSAAPKRPTTTTSTGAGRRGAAPATKAGPTKAGPAKSGPKQATPRKSTAVSKPTGRPGRRTAPDPALPVMGVDTCRTGWVGAVLDPSGHGTPHLFVKPTIAELVAEAGPLAVVAVPVPIGLPDESRREADRQARTFLGPAGAAVVPTPVRDAVYAATFGEANQVNRAKIGAGVAQQAYALRPRIVEVDAWLRQDLPFTVVEVSPEVSFAEMAGAPLGSRRRSHAGTEERRTVLADHGVVVPGALPVGVATDDVVDACAAAWTAHRVKTGQARSLPEQPETFSDGIPAAIHV
ncbi:hypothetical protein GCM10009584_21870 [Ornithinimicrobium humiphilum]|uniref:Putative RNase H-like nuclease n=1 Tax=Ornithinimicrobium humiphilum TaxID=125288 RepID=A0A543KN76_9MICO|nr:DUF429 domain-containing protein [Ornithinimicrobium humiphilum]TQM96519.1 putative RNase H-like nuclease [Ornithinimicrobium humiphilum]